MRYRFAMGLDPPATAVAFAFAFRFLFPFRLAAVSRLGSNREQFSSARTHLFADNCPTDHVGPRWQY